MIDPALLQFADGLFPSGGFAHSLGLETLVAEGRVRDRADIEAFLLAHLEGSAGPCDAVALARARAASAAGDAPALLALDAELDAMKPVASLREASAQMGRQTLRVAAALAPGGGVPALAEAVEGRRTPGHHAVVLGAVAGALGFPAEDAAAAYLHATAAMLAGAGVRLLGLGQVDGQRAIFAVRPVIARLARQAGASGAGADALWSFAPHLEIAAARHAALDARLFRS